MRLKEGLQLLNVGHDYFVVDPETGDHHHTYLYTMNEATAHLWELFTGQDFYAEDMEAALCEAYDVEPEQARTDIQQLLDTWTENGLLL